MALRQLVEAECGGANPLVQWTTHFAETKPLNRESIGRDRIADIAHHAGPRAAEEEMVQEFLGGRHAAVPQTFNMSSLLRELQPAELQPVAAAGPGMRQKDAAVQKWVNEFGPAAEAPSHADVNGDHHQWVDEFAQQHEQHLHDQWLREFEDGQISESEQWAREFERDSDGRDLAAIAREMSDTVTDPQLKATEFMKFIEKLGTGELSVQDNKVTGDPLTSEWANEFHKETRNLTGTEEDFWERMEKDWSEMAKGEPAHPWLKEFEQNEKEYKFSEENPLKDVANPMEEGLKKLKEGDLPSAVLLFEAEVQQRPQNIKGWQYLGTTQADNEHELAAIAALDKCLQLDPVNLQALMALGVSYTNESLGSKACDSLKQWLRANPKYSHLVPPDEASAVPQKPFMHSFMSKEEHTAVVDLYLKAAQSSPDVLDPDVQVGLGVLFNLSNEYDKAVDCFTAALQARPDDAMLWNKLGATLANGNRSDDAIHAYRHALEHMPGFTRSRYNLGISCINLKAYQEAIEHFITALNMQQQAEAPPGTTSSMSESIWSTLRLAVSMHGRPDLLHMINDRNLHGLMEEFEMKH